MDIYTLDYCDECSSDLELHDSGSYRDFDWIALKCTSCGKIFSDEPKFHDEKY